MTVDCSAGLQSRTTRRDSSQVCSVVAGASIRQHDGNFVAIGKGSGKRFYPCCSCRESEILRIEVGRRRLTTGCRTLVRRNGRVALNQRYARDRDAQFFRDQLGLRDKHALPEVALSRVSRDSAVCANRQPGIQLLRIDVSRMGIELSLGPERQYGQRGGAETHHQRAAAFQKITP